MPTTADESPLAGKVDRRIVRTRAAIADAFLSLVSEADYSKITVTALAQRADIDRKTFYTHYNSLDEVLNDIVRQRLKQSIGALNLSEFYADASRFTKDLLLAFDAALPLSIDEQRMTIDHLPADKILSCWTAAAKECIIAQAGPMPADTQRHIDVLLDFYLGGIFNAYTHWLKDKDAIPFDALLTLLVNGMTNGLSGLMDRHANPA